jgi:hypothetical protein
MLHINPLNVSDIIEGSELCPINQEPPTSSSILFIYEPRILKSTSAHALKKTFVARTSLTVQSSTPNIKTKRCQQQRQLSSTDVVGSDLLLPR